MSKPNTQYDEIMRALEKVDDFLAAKANATPEFEATNDPERPWRMEYAFESTTIDDSRYRRNNADV